MISAPALEPYRIRIEGVLDGLLNDKYPGLEGLHEAMRYSLMAGGKRIRPGLVYASGEALKLTPGILDNAAAAVECIHTYSLIHDDLPAMDDDDLRRGKATAHKVFGEAMAILAGDALQAFAFELLSKPVNGVTADNQLQMISLLSTAAGSHGMVGGQAIDLAAVGHSLDEQALAAMHSYKTGALIKACVLLPTYCNGNTTEQQRSALADYASAIGLAFQVQDDIIDLESDTEMLGKTQGADLAANKPTYPAILGMEGARLKLHQLYDEAMTALGSFSDEANTLREIAGFIVKRVK